ncbi:MAG: DMT family transporter [Candidatus Aenigmarchaeota archaeon]|nr:DMT family transporter [Candidatus Aenigmarchaeota archaeon]
MDFLLGVIFAFIALVTFGVSTPFSRYPIKKIGLSSTIAYRGAITAIVALLVFIAMPFQYSFDPLYIIIAFFIGIIGFIPYLTFLKALDKGKIGIIAPITDSSFLVTIFLSVMFYGEIFTPLNWLAVLIILAGMVSLSFDFKSVKRYGLKMLPGVSYAIITFFLWGIFYFIERVPVMIIGPYLLLLVVEIGVFAPATVYLGATGKFKRPDRETMKFLLITGISTAVGGLCFNIAITLADVGLVTTITKSAPIVALLTAKLLFGEKLKRRQYISVIVVLLGVILLSLA